MIDGLKFKNQLISANKLLLDNIEIVKHQVIKHKNTVVGLKNVNQSFLDKVKIQKEQKSVSGSQPNIDTD